MGVYIIKDAKPDALGTAAVASLIRIRPKESGKSGVPAEPVLGPL